MKSFIYKILLFSLIPVLLYVVVFSFLKYQLTNQIEKSPIIILGDSQTEYINLPNIYNRSLRGTPYCVHYEFAKEFINQVKGKKIYIACNYNNISKLYQNRLANDSEVPGYRAEVFQYLDEYNLFNHEYPEIRPKDLKYTIFDIKKIPKLFHYLYFPREKQNSLKSIENDTLSIKSAIYGHWNNPSNVLRDSIQKEYIEKLIMLLKNNNCEIILLKMPLANYYINNVPTEIKKELIQIPHTYKIRLLDLNDTLKISNNYSYFLDYGHLNKNGYLIIANYFKKNEIK